MNEVKTNSFNGLNRLSVTAEGEGAVFRDLSLKSYPTAESETVRRTGVVFIKLDGVDVTTDDGKLQGVGDIVLRDGKYYLTGVYDGVFYYEGEAVEYYGKYGEDDKLTCDDRIEIIKIGTQYIILGVRSEGKSVIWSYNTLGTSYGSEKDREGDGKLKTEIIALPLPQFPLSDLCLYKISCNNDETKAQIIEEATKKSYYMLYMYKKHSEAEKDKGYKFPKEKKALDIYNKYGAFMGSQIIMKKQSTVPFHPDGYCFKNEGEHPIKFVLDVAGVGKMNGGDMDVIELLYIKESESNDINQDFHSRNESMLEPRTVDGKTGQYLTKYLSDGTVAGINLSPTAEGSGIIGHFEVWNEALKRYEPYYNNEPIYKQIDETGKVIYPKDKGVTNVDENESFYYTKNVPGRSYTRINLDYAGAVNESVKLTHIASCCGRIFATIKGGDMIMYSALGKYTNFSELEGVGSDSGFFNDSTEGEYTGLCEYSGTLLAFKENRISVYYGTPPNMTRSRDITGIGCIDCRSIKEVRGVLYFLGKDGFYAYSGGMPKRISRKLAREYKSAFAYERDGCYVADAVCEDGTRETVTYYPELDMWSEGEGVGILSEDGGLLISDEGKVLEYSRGGEWCYETGDIYEGIFEDKGINEIYIRGRINGSFKVTTVSDDEEFIHSEISDDTMRLKVWRIPVRLKHKNHYRIRIEGNGICVLYALERSSYIGGKKR